MGVSDWFFLFVRWLHLLAAVAWIGGSAFFLLVLRPSLQGTSLESALTRVAGQEFRNLVDVAVTVLLFTGAILSISRLTSGYAGPLYGAVLGLKVALSVWMFYLVWFRQRRRSGVSETVAPGPLSLEALRRSLNANNLILGLGIVVLLLADLLGALFERGIAAG